MKRKTGVNQKSICTLQLTIPDFNILEHKQRGMYILLDGEMMWKDCNNTYHITPNEILFTHPGSYATKTNTESCQVLWLPLHMEFLRSFLKRFGPLLSKIERQDFPARRLIPFDQFPLLTESIQGLVNLLAHDYPPAVIQLRVEELLLLLTLGKQGELLMSILRKLSNRQVERLQTFMESHYLKEWKLNDFAREFGMGLTSFKELFNSIYGTSPKAWISEQRILYAHQLLLNSEMSIAEISLESGFSSQSYFTQSYRRRFGCTPNRSRYGKD
ncbi:helix-turn-helix transcriptional regulator [Xenorhabdus szentirmaii]|uniref:Exoenzyme S synthesis regulatory protein exsA n=2 Tax=Xenorhabdus szentirmaii TaxID=290112 RepID=W1J0Y6_9GAMM|nr:MULTISPECIES: AraC family transcriptional regulator [Xenorhabdus]MBD2779863.1 helix-turn-helix transcriptional regulator [Xenorhabdus sp. 38]MBD2793503.1 helix-turn-helix transcriptional regulator [Xenorhabdus sp. CUL]MBD2800228.1 helix-turn-helix transcriptional regulator [Xenorhabdus sp. M]MBD2819881.1 helix-turn-helix transcriptional regulator [Xenorhabdus sp. 42]MBD2826829.1 helix-turn-helix transcriptional regulator [Xenorhabdus sp. 5]